MARAMDDIVLAMAAMNRVNHQHATHHKLQQRQAAAAAAAAAATERGPLAQRTPRDRTDDAAAHSSPKRARVGAAPGPPTGRATLQLVEGGGGVVARVRPGWVSTGAPLYVLAITDDAAVLGRLRVQGVIIKNKFFVAL